jgi:hypothetical protein
LTQRDRPHLPLPDGYNLETRIEPDEARAIAAALVRAADLLDPPPGTTGRTPPWRAVHAKLGAPGVLHRAAGPGARLLWSSGRR